MYTGILDMFNRELGTYAPFRKKNVHDNFKKSN